MKQQINSSKRIMVLQGGNTSYYYSYKSLFRAFYTGAIRRDRLFSCIIEAYRTDSTTPDIKIVLYKEVCQTFAEVKSFYRYLSY